MGIKKHDPEKPRRVRLKIDLVVVFPPGNPELAMGTQAHQQAILMALDGALAKLGAVEESSGKTSFAVAR
jgi:hypothetical protein